jgi:hypothetical protein
MKTVLAKPPCMTDSGAVKNRKSLNSRPWKNEGRRSVSNKYFTRTRSLQVRNGTTSSVDPFDNEVRSKDRIAAALQHPTLSSTCQQ